MAAYIAIILSSICLILLVTVLIKFKRLFSTESIIEKTRLQMNKIISDINKNANMDIDLINDATKRTRNLMLEADNKMQEFKQATEMLRDMIATVEKQTKTSFKSNTIYQNSLMDEIKPLKKSENYVGTAKSYKANAYKVKNENSHQQSLFDENQDNKSSSLNITLEKSENNDNEDKDLIPKIVTNIIPDSNSKKSINEKVERLFNSGMQVDDIALELSCSISEVQFIIDMLNERG